MHIDFRTAFGTKRQLSDILTCIYVCMYVWIYVCMYEDWIQEAEDDA